MHLYFISRRPLILFFVLSLIPFLYLCAQGQGNTDIDSLEFLLQKAPEDKKPAILNRLAFRYHDISLLKSRRYALKALKISRTLNHEDEESKALVNLGLFKLYTTQSDSAITYFKDAYNIRASIGDTLGMGNTLNNIGLWYYEKTRYLDAKRYYDSAHHLYLKIRSPDKISKYYINFGLCEQEMGNYHEAYQSYHKAIDIIEEHKLHYLSHYVDRALATMYFKMGHKDRALTYARKLMINLNEKPNSYFALLTCNLISDIFSSKNILDSSLYYSKQALQHAKILGNKKHIARCLNQTGLVYLQTKNYRLALSNFQASLRTSRELAIHRDIAKNLIDIARLFVQQTKYTEAINRLKDALKHASLIKAKDLKATCYKLLSDAHSAIGQYQNAHHYSTLQIIISDSIFNEKRSEQIRELQTKYETEKQRLKINSLQLEANLKDAQLSRNKMFVILLAATLITFLILIIIWRHHFKARQKTTLLLYQKNEEVQSHLIGKLIKEQELSIIKANLEGQENEKRRIAKELHDGIGGLLAAIKMELLKVSDRDYDTVSAISERLDQACKEIRTISHHLTPPTISNNHFAMAVKKYLEDISSLYHITTEFNCFPEDELDDLDDIIKTELYRIIQELTTNVVRHAKAKHQLVQLVMHEGYINLLVADDGTGINGSTGKGIGLYNINSRIKVLCGNFTIDSQPGKGTTVNIDIPLN